MDYTIVCAVTDDVVKLRDNSPEAYVEGMKELKETYCSCCEYKNNCPYGIEVKEC